MSLSNRSFRDNRTGEVVKVIDSFENIAILENKTKIDVRRLMDPSHFTEEIDPTKFLDTRPAYNSIFEEIKKLPTNNIPDDNGEIKPTVQMDSRYVPPAEDDSAVIYTSVDDEKEELARKYGINMNSGDAVSRQNEAFARILGEDTPEAAEIPAPAPVRRMDEEPVQRIEVDRDERPVSVSDGQPKIDPVITMFKGIKRSVDFTLDVKLENKIPRLDFIEMMEDSYERSIIDYLAAEFTDELMRNPQSLRQSIADKIREMVYGKPKPVRKAPARKPAAKKPAAKKHDALPIEKEPMLAKDLEKVAAPKRKRVVKKESEQQ
jgi:hypothetical protein